ncbi:MAG: tyrosine recombinase XerD [Schleiferiaceae bacterium]|nr:tyrosine recombinase XerD [Schleiferiaceae bacterium]
MHNWTTALSAFDDFLLLQKGLALNTRMAYQRDISKLQQLFPDLSPVEITHNILQAGIATLQESGMATRSQSRWISAIKAFFLFLVQEEVLAASPAELLEAPKLGLYLPDFLTTKEVDALLQAIDRSTLEGERNFCMLEWLYACGLRVSELVELKLSDVHANDLFISVVGKGNKERLIPIYPRALDLFQLYLKYVRTRFPVQKGFEDYAFLNRRGKKLTREMIFIIVKKAAEKAGIKKKISPHTFRHTFATHLVQNGADLRVVQDLLGHESITTTEIYTHLDKQFVRSQLERFHPLSKSKL